MDDLLLTSREIVNRAIADYPPYATVLMLSGGDDSLTAYYVARAIGIKIDFILHGITGTGIPETTNFVRQVGANSGLRYIEADAKDAFEQYVTRRGYFGIGYIAHEHAYHLLKSQRFSAALSRHIRQGQKGRNILLLNGARKEESDNRKRSMIVPIKRKKDTRNFWVNIINDWTKLDCRDFLADYQRNPVVDLIHRSGECLCGTMQWPYQETRKEVSFWFPKWGAWVDDLDKRVCERGFCWKWGEDMPEKVKRIKYREKQLKNGQFDMFDHWLPMCQTCQLQQQPEAAK